MNQSASAFLVLFVALLNCVFNPFFRRTRKGLFIVHWAFVNYITASRHYLDLTYNPGDLSLLAATLFVLVEHLSTRHCAGFFAGTVQSLKAIGRLVVELKAIRVEKVKTIADSDDPELTPAQQPTVIKLV
ncbi:hypothetical protein QR680_002684 [Steinernema hermaphroditum]|uniref:Uncharacterized protein n=1 Tax=Steinernema hermaphroditum TaxID=289476 RepID=A0AA39H3M7_9BILA|nr:hypothetical protein QR680_002684 [Steinernema hermaphroditum]